MRAVEIATEWHRAQSRVQYLILLARGNARHDSGDRWPPAAEAQWREAMQAQTTVCSIAGTLLAEGFEAANAASMATGSR